MNNLLNNLNKVRANVEVVKAEEAAKTIKQYGGLDVYNLMKEGNLYAIIIDGVIVGGANSKEEAEKGAELLSHFSGGKPLDKTTIMSVMRKCYDAMNKGQNIKEATDAGINFKDQFVLDNEEYLVDDTGELMRIDGYHIGNVADIMTAKNSGSLTKELYEEILKGRIQKKLEEDRAIIKENYEDCDDYYYDDYDDEE